MHPHMQFMLGVCTWPNLVANTFLSLGDRPEVEKRVLVNSLVSELFTDTDDALKRRNAGSRRAVLKRAFILV